MKTLRSPSEGEVTASELESSGRPANPAEKKGNFVPFNTVRLAVWLALTAGLVEGSIRLIQSGVFHRVIGMSPHVIWMAPLANLLWLGVPAAGLYLLETALPRRSIRTLSASVLLTIALLSLVLLYQGMHKGAAVILCFGLGWQLAIRLAHSERFARLIRRTLPWLVVIPVLGGLVIAGSRWNRERQMLAAVPAAIDQPNVLLIIWDTVRGQNMSVYGYDRPTTRFLERFESQGTRFDRAMATAPWTLPSHGSMFTGRWPAELRARLRTPLADSFPRLAQAFSDAGYATGGFASNVAYCSREHGLHRGFQHYEDYQIAPGRIIGSSRLGRVLSEQPRVRDLFGYYEILGRKTAEDVNEGFLSWIDKRNSRPFFAFLNYFDAHQPYLPPEPFRGRFSTKPDEFYRPTTVDTKFADVTQDEIRWSAEQYDGAIAYQDSAVANLMAELDRRGLLENTLVIITSDHGEHFGEHRRLSHANSLYRQLLQVPLLMRFPGRVPAGLRVQDPVSLRDLPQTILRLVGVSDSLGFPGASLARHWQEAADSARRPYAVFSESFSLQGPRAYSLVADGYHYVKWFGRDPELYDIDRDPLETADLAATPEGPTIMARLESLSEPFLRLPANQGD